MSTRTFSNTNTTVFAQPKVGGTPLGPVYFPSINTTGNVVCTQTENISNPMVSCILPNVFSNPDPKSTSTPKNGYSCLISKGIDDTPLFGLGQLKISADSFGDIIYECTNIIGTFPTE